uniref:SFRICE_015940 n=1 Tax=Spodoptera frugiperda TaxID=7108 RepID=A0A2H1VAP5_SPOFR
MVIQIKTVKSEQVLTAAVKVLNNTWHRRFGVSFDEKCGSNKASCTVCCEGNKLGYHSLKQDVHSLFSEMENYLRKCGINHQKETVIHQSNMEL